MVGEVMIFPPEFELLLARTLLRVLPKFPSAYIGGGCLRDMLLKKPIKDIDVFIHVPGAALAKDIGLKLMDVFDTSVGIMCSRNNDGESYDIGEMVGVFNCGMTGEYPVQVIALDDDRVEQSFDNPVDRFDFGICQIAYIGGKLIATEAFRKDVNDKTFTLMVNDSTRRERAQRRYDRLREKYEGYALVIPNEFLEASPA